ncbi:F-box/FBD/LRR-repeat protein At1g13570-like [Solanum pennellii]|uniref:F-box/FBD/LRR-repeat protein At1g13570-like n=1 Tax=Solanum pennellii TaxID=28526 RepID=A0ABM1GKM4_SOLPN|nr:F-box/FBD/LRR-repeat protein At1g13570-like [Solanum pennellii]
MELDIADHLNYIEINAPKLSSLKLGSKLNSICFKNTPLLTDVSIIMANDVNHDLVNRGTCNLVEFFGSLPALKNLCLGHPIIKILITRIIDRIPEKLPMPLVNLRKIYLFDVCLSDLHEIRCLLCLIKSSPYLEEIIVIINQAINKEGVDDLRVLKHLEAQYDSGIKLNRLTKVKLIDVMGTKVEMEFIKLLLATSPMLEKMMIAPYYIEPESPQTLVEILKEIPKMTEEVPSRRSCDRISGLPINAIDDILTRLPLRDAVKTSILSRKWRYDWAKVTKLTLDESLWKDLSTHEVRVKLEHLETLISRCPLLEDIELDISNPLRYIQLNAPNLKFLNIGSKIISICFKNTSFLADVSIMAENLNHGPVESLDVNRDFVERGTCDLREFFGSLPAIKNLRLDHFIIKTLITGIDEIPMTLPMPLLNLRKIYLFDICLTGLGEIRFLLCLIKSSPNLEEIIIINQAINNERGDDLTSLELLKAEYDSGIKLNRLTNVSLIDIRGTKTEMKFIKLLLAKSPVLEKMMISPFYIGPESPQTLVEILMQINTFQRASPRAIINFNF